jgi:hypothetical protein
MQAYLVVLRTLAEELLLDIVDTCIPSVLGLQLDE